MRKKNMIMKTFFANNCRSSILVSIQKKKRTFRAVCVGRCRKISRRSSSGISLILRAFFPTSSPCSKAPKTQLFSFLAEVSSSTSSTIFSSLSAPLTILSCAVVLLSIPSTSFSSKSVASCLTYSPHCRPDFSSLHFANVVICVEFCFTLWKSAFPTFGFETEQAADQEAVQCFALGKDDLLLRLATGVDDQ